jgi:hypothetical protein
MNVCLRVRQKLYLILCDLYISSCKSAAWRIHIPRRCAESSEMHNQQSFRNFLVVASTVIGWVGHVRNMQVPCNIVVPRL